MKIEKSDGLCRLILDGDVDSWWLHQHEGALQDLCENSIEMVVLDVSAVNFADSTILTVMELFLRHTEPQRGAVCLVGASPMIRKLLKMFGLQTRVMMASAIPPAGQPQRSTQPTRNLNTHTDWLSA
jgi:anti-anti-sigma factor